MSCTGSIFIWFGNSGRLVWLIFQDFPGLFINIKDFQGQTSFILKFHEYSGFPRLVRTLIISHLIYLLFILNLFMLSFSDGYTASRYARDLVRSVQAYTQGQLKAGLGSWRSETEKHAIIDDMYLRLENTVAKDFENFHSVWMVFVVVIQKIRQN